MLTALPAARPSDSPSVGTLPCWIDLVDPTESELAFVQDSTGLRLPSREDLSEIESTSRLYMEGEALYLSTPLIARADEAGGGWLTPAGFILTRSVLITLRWDKVGAFETVRKAVEADHSLCSSDVFTRVLEAIVDRAADLLERVGSELDALSGQTFCDPPDGKSRNGDPLRAKLRLLGRLGDRLSQVRDALLGVGRIAPYAAEAGRAWIPAEVESRLGAVKQDIASLNDYEAHLSTKVQFLLDAVLGFINIEQNDVVKVLTIASTVGVPPVLVAGVYGMNFHIMPELSWRYGYPFAIVLMVVSALLPLIWFRWRGWM